MSRMLLLAACAFLLAAEFAPAQVNYNQRDDKYRVLGLKRAKEAYETARREFDRQQELYRRQLISSAELDRSRNVFADAEVNYQQSLLAVLFEQQFVSVARAVKYQSKSGINRVRLTVANTSGETAEFRKLLNIDDALFRSLQPDIVDNVYVSLSNAEGAIISQPYETKISRLRYGKPATVDFILLQEVDAVTVNLIYGNGTTRSMKIYLQKDASVNRVVVQSQQFSQEVELGTSATFDLTLELFSSTGGEFGLEVLNLPAQINRTFKDPATQARLNQFKFTGSVNTRNSSLVISLPDRPNDEVVMDRPLPFYVVVVPRSAAKALTDHPATTPWTEEEIDHLNAGYVKLELVPRGKGRILVRAPQLFYPVSPGGSVAMTADLVNEGSRRLDNIEVKIDPPLHWTSTVEPRIVTSLGIGEERRIRLTFTPPGDVPAGRYEVRLRTSGLSDNQPVNAEDKTVTVEVAAPANVLGTALVVLLIVGLAAGMVIVGVRLSKK
jgi:uncharacterized membrane protein